MDRGIRLTSEAPWSNFRNGLIGTVIVGLSVLFISCGVTDQTSTPATGAAAPDASSGSTQLRLPESASGYYGVYTSGNVVLFGRLVNADDDWVTLTDVHYIRSNVDAEKKEVANQLVKRTGEWHQPNESAIARQNILVVEPVTQDSRMMTLIREMK